MLRIKRLFIKVSGKVLLALFKSGKIYTDKQKT